MARTTNIPAFKLYIATSKRPPSLTQFILHQLVLECTTRGYKYIYIYIYIYWSWKLGWWLAFTIVRARFLACLGHTVRIIENTVIGKLVFGGSLAFLFHHLGYADLSPAHLHALLTEILNIRNYMPPVPPLEPVVCHELIQATDPKVAIKPLSDYIK